MTWLREYLRSRVEAASELSRITQTLGRGPSREGYVLERGRAYLPSPLNRKEKRLVAEAVRSMSFEVEPGSCFYNSQGLVAADPTSSLVYTEGWATAYGFPFEHGWVSLNGKVVDLTWPIDIETGGFVSQRWERRNLGVWDAGVFAYWGAEFPSVDWNLHWEEAGDEDVTVLSALNRPGSLLSRQFPARGAHPSPLHGT